MGGFHKLSETRGSWCWKSVQARPVENPRHVRDVGLEIIHFCEEVVKLCIE